MTVSDLEQARFLASWRTFIHAWADKVIAQHGGASQADRDDIRQAAYEAAWTAYLECKQQPEHEDPETLAKMRISRATKNAALTHWYQLRGLPRDDKQRGAGRRARLLRETLAQIAATELRYCEERLEVTTDSLIAYQLLMVGLVHGTLEAEPPDTRVLHQEVKQRLAFAINKLAPEQHELIVSVYFEHQSLREVGERLGRSKSSTSRLHCAALRVLRDEMIAFASSLSPRAADRPTGGTPSPDL